MIKAVIFDKDGVITDTIPFFYKIMKNILKEYSIDLTFDYYYEHNIMRMETIYGRIKQHLTRKEYIDKIRSRYNEMFGELSLIPNIKESINELKKEYIIALTTGNSAYATLKEMEYFELIHYFKEITTEDDVEHSKPDPALYKLTLKKLNLKPSEVVAIEDSLSGLKSATGAGIRTIILLNGHNKSYNFKSAWKKVNHLSEIKGILDHEKVNI